MKKLLFPVKLGLLASSVLVLLALSACGYHAAYAGETAVAFSVSASPAKTPNLAALEAALAGARAELSRAGALRAGNGYPRLVVELLRVDELASGIAAGATAGQTPLARASSVGVTARAWVEQTPSAPPSRDSGDLRRVEEVAQGGEAVASQFAFDEAARSAARRAGQGAARRVLGVVEPSVDPM